MNIDHHRLCVELNRLDWARELKEEVIQPADFVIAPDVTSFDITEFTRADEMAAIGETTTNASVHNLKTMLSKLDPKLFP